MYVISEVAGDEVLAFIQEQQREPASATAYLDSPDVVAEELGTLSPPWRETVRAAYDGDRLVGAVVVEWSAETGRAWLYGPWTAPHYWQEVACDLARAAIAQVPAAIDDFEVSADVANQRMRWLAGQLGWAESDVYFIYEAPAGRLRRDEPDPPQIRAATADDLDGIARLHDAAFPRTYLTVAQCVIPERVTLVYADADGIVGYVSGQRLPGGAGALDFLAVAPERRRQGIGRALVVAGARQVGGDRVMLHSSDRFRDSWALFRELGFSLVSAFRGYRGAREASPR